MSAARKLRVVSINEHPVKIRVKLREKPRAKLDMHRLPFVGRDHVTNEDGSYCFWDVPLTGGYFGGNETGQALAFTYLAHLRRMNGSKAHPLHTLSLRSIFGAMMKRTPGSKAEKDSRSGQLVGFASVIDDWLRAAVDQFGRELDDIDHKKLLALANAGLVEAEAQARLSKKTDDAQSLAAATAR
ncbi:hypothetical protein I5P84_02570 [Pseudomonas mosselii]|uniref:hypothetical protein n=1 Tax=Pseudomonas mosselii TaxID=78327 RepID=UPI0018D95341|nr:hypothetical protein [Pseudomonas mosselii]MBH3308338.1 hypothetical protein [Pseudomonas mosselii]MBH3324090.1 hypothetical protein [Pseudomonas mosselii]